LRAFVRGRLQGYALERSEPKAWHVSELSPYLHFGQIGVTRIARAVRDGDAGSDEDARTYLEELVVRRELATNYVWFEEDYDRWSALPEWARRTLRQHAKDRREHVYGDKELVACATHDARWNAAMREMVHTGYMHNTLRMYWAKKILEWSESPQIAFERALALNNRYFLDGRDPSSYTNVAWCFGLHDRPWGERPIYGTVRSMTLAGLERKFDMDGYERAVDALVERETR
jgi:deoxyribodipyrimidine photo-lyase